MVYGLHGELEDLVRANITTRKTECEVIAAAV